jgi:hypothetical protein
MEREERRSILTHEPVPGYRAAFLVVLGIAVFYLALILVNTM